MWILKSLIMAVLMVAILPWCNFAAAWSATDHAAFAQGAHLTTSVEPMAVDFNDTEIVQPEIAASPKDPRNAMLPQSVCAWCVITEVADLQVNHGTPGKVKALGANALSPRHARPPPISPPRSF